MIEKFYSILLQLDKLCRFKFFQVPLYSRVAFC